MNYLPLLKSIIHSLFIIMVTSPLVFSDPLIIAHRGNSSVAPENTIAAVKSAVNLNPQPAFVEIDLHRSKDGKLMVCHDDNTLKTTGVAGMIREMLFADLRKLDAGYKKVFGNKYKGEKLPTLTEVLNTTSNESTGVMIECKQLLLEDAVIDLLKQRDEIDKHVLASFDELTVYRAKKIEPTIKTLYLTGDLTNTSLWRAVDVKADIIGAGIKSEPKWIKAAQSKGFEVWVWTVDDESKMLELANIGVDGIITNKPALAHEVLASNKTNKQ